MIAAGWQRERKDLHCHTVVQIGAFEAEQGGTSKAEWSLVSNKATSTSEQAMQRYNSWLSCMSGFDRGVPLKVGGKTKPSNVSTSQTLPRRGPRDVARGKLFGDLEISETPDDT